MNTAIERVVNLGVADQSESEVRRIQTINVTALFGMFFNVLYIPWLALISVPELWLVMTTNSIFVALTVLVLVVNGRGHTHTSMWLLTIGIWLNLSFATLLVGPPVFWFLLVIPIAGVLITREGDWVVQVVHIVAGALILLVVLLVDPETAEPMRGTANETALLVMSGTGTAIFIGVITLYFKQLADSAEAAMRAANQRSEELLLNILPGDIADRLKAGEAGIADRFEAATVLFADVVDFTPISASMSADDLVSLLDEVFRSLDGLVDSLHLEKIKTIGDAYMVAAGIPVPRPDHAEAVAELALRIRETVEENKFGGRHIQLRIGMHSGPVVAGIIGHRKFSYDLWGDTVNVASRLESHGVPGQIQISKATRDLIAGTFLCERRGMVELKGKGEVEAWFLQDRLSGGFELG